MTAAAGADAAALRVVLDAHQLVSGDEGLAALDAALGRLEAGRSCRLRILEVRGDAPLWDTSGMGPELERWGERLAAEATRTGALRIGLADGILRGPALEMVLACDLVVLDPRARVLLFPPGEGYLPVAGGLTRALRRAGPGRLLPACLGAEAIDARRALEIGLASAVLDRDGMAGLTARLEGSDARALAAVADLSRRGAGLGGRQAEALERAVFSWCFAGGRPPQAIRAYRGRHRNHGGHGRTGPPGRGEQT